MLLAAWRIGNLSIDPIEFLYAIAFLAPSIILHEVSHGWAAYAFGDPTAKEQKRLSLNPIRHVDPFGTVMLPLMLAFAGAPPFGWAKPVPIDPKRMRSPRNHSLLTALAGPAMNLLIVAVMTAGILLFRIGDSRHPVFVLGVYNLILATFNLIPIPPLDGSAVVERFIPVRFWSRYLRIRPYSLGLLLLLVFAVPDRYGLGRLFVAVVDGWAHLLSLLFRTFR